MTTFERVAEIFEQVFEGDISVENMTLESKLKEDVGLNSIGMLYMAMALEEEFGVKFTNEDFVNIVTVADVVARVESK
ncbi:MAG: acyl carrier protein [Ruminococcaceae bacterium]|nr:acyl carrier protein [Oscillospiraceae bacterium]